MSTSSVRSVSTKGLRPLRVGASPVPHAEILESVRTTLAESQIDLQVIVFDSFDEPNDWLAAGRLHANYFQYLPFLEQFNRTAGTALAPVVAVHIEPFGLYSSRVTSLAAIPDYAEVALPADAVNADRSLMMLDRLGLLDCRPDEGQLATTTDVRANPRRLVFKELTSWTMASALDDFDAVFLFGNQAMERNVHTDTALHCDRGDPGYAEYLVTQHAGQTNPDVVTLAAALTGPQTRLFIETTYSGQVIPAF
ncbi:metal ABC transporter substrate-binding protein [Mycolicibacterium neoaurum]|uniref:MetQ/NlpA family ABC transporter substrate-binding protein n=1 Tax=Mycolicibacterium neoaurum TaxID=1795 RepID=UPI001BD1B2CB|nr:MetQ/NlpA family ABC transporter substrate-binding protein [Mycolicibacterium neoaurum]QVI25759.1 metal ABC transporter substrate-binding protein [Mycolicibacterium neoaurum]